MKEISLEGIDFLGKVYRNHNNRSLEDGFGPRWSFAVGANLHRRERIHTETLKNKRTGFEIQTTYKMSHSNTIVAGITYEEMKQYDVRSQGTFYLLLYFPLPGYD